MEKIYHIGSLRNEKVPQLGHALRKQGWDIFDSWFGAGKIADDSWQEYCNGRGLNFVEALADHGAQCVFHFDRDHINESKRGTLILPAGKSGHLELGVLIGQGKPGYIVMEKEPERYDVMYNFAAKVFLSYEEYISFMADEIRKLKGIPVGSIKCGCGLVQSQSHAKCSHCDRAIGGSGYTVPPIQAISDCLRLDRTQMMAPPAIPDGRLVIGRDGYCKRAETRCLCNQHNRKCCAQWVSYAPNEGR